MPLPPALAARLAKRGILKPQASENEPVEEVIAEDYDDHYSVSTAEQRTHQKPAIAIVRDTKTDTAPTQEPDPTGTGELVYEVLQCPNQANEYHTCSEYCKNRWGHKRFKADPSSLRGRDHLLKRYPLPPGWLEVADPETGRYYYWNSDTDEVAWLSPLHPRAVITISAEKLKELSGASGVMAVDSGLQEAQRGAHSDDDDASTDLDDENYPDEDEEQDFEEMEREFKRKMQSERDRGKDHRRRGGRVDDSLDPMDPAAYSDVPRGSWTSGMETQDSAKTGADVTAAGPLFQQRPYPSPGAVLRMNKSSDRDAK